MLIDEHLAEHRAVEEGDNPILSVEASVDDEVRHEALVKRTPIANRRLYLAWAGVGPEDT